MLPAACASGKDGLRRTITNWTLTLHLQADLSYNEIGRALKISKSVAGKYVSLARAAGIDWVVAQTQARLPTLQRRVKGPTESDGAAFGRYAVKLAQLPVGANSDEVRNG